MESERAKHTSCCQESDRPTLHLYPYPRLSGLTYQSSPIGQARVTQVANVPVPRGDFLFAQLSHWIQCGPSGPSASALQRIGLKFTFFSLLICSQDTDPFPQLIHIIPEHHLHLCTYSYFVLTHTPNTDVWHVTIQCWFLRKFLPLCFWNYVQNLPGLITTSPLARVQTGQNTKQQQP